MYNYTCNQEGKTCVLANRNGDCMVTACVKRGEQLYAVYKEGLKVWPPEDPVDIHDEISAGFSRIEKAIREESAKMAEIIREAVHQNDIYPVTQYKIPNILPVPDPCKNCSNHPSNGGTGICFCTLGTPKIT